MQDNSSHSFEFIGATAGVSTGSADSKLKEAGAAACGYPTWAVHNHLASEQQLTPRQCRQHAPAGLDPLLHDAEMKAFVWGVQIIFG